MQAARRVHEGKTTDARQRDAVHPAADPEVGPAATMHRVPLIDNPRAFGPAELEILLFEDGELLVLNERGEIVAWHTLSAGSNQRVVVAEHYAGIPFSSLKPRRAGARQVAVQDLTPIPWPDAPLVEARPLGIYQDLAELGS